MNEEFSEEKTVPSSGSPGGGLKRGKKEEVWAKIQEVMDPELHMSIVKLGLVYSVEVRGDHVDVEMTLTSPGCPFGPQLIYAVEMAARSVEGVEEVSVNVVWEPAWGPDQMSEEAKLELGFDI